MCSVPAAVTGTRARVLAELSQSVTWCGSGSLPYQESSRSCGVACSSDKQVVSETRTVDGGPTASTRASPGPWPRHSSLSGEALDAPNSRGGVTWAGAVNSQDDPGKAPVS